MQCLWCAENLEEEYLEKLRREDSAPICERCKSKKGKLSDLDVKIRSGATQLSEGQRQGAIHDWLKIRFGDGNNDTTPVPDLWDRFKKWLDGSGKKVKERYLLENYTQTAIDSPGSRLLLSSQDAKSILEDNECFRIETSSAEGIPINEATLKASSSKKQEWPKVTLGKRWTKDQLQPLVLCLLAETPDMSLRSISEKIGTQYGRKPHINTIQSTKAYQKLHIEKQPQSRPVNETASGVSAANQAERVVADATEVSDTIIDFEDRLGRKLISDERAAVEFEYTLNADVKPQEKAAKLRELFKRIGAGDYENKSAH